MNNVDPVTFTTPEVNGNFNGWCGSCAPMSDPDGDNIWDVTIALAAGSYEFKYSADNWGIQETLLPGSPCTVTNFGFTNRTLNVSADSTLDVVCWESCDPCGSGPASYNVTFEVDMNSVSQPFTTPEINGVFNGWCGNCWQMTDPDGDNIWEYTTVFAPVDSIEWKYSADNCNIQEDLDSNLSCVTINYDPGAPNGWGYVNRVAVITGDTTFSSPWELCDGSTTGTGSLSQIDLPITWDDTTVDYTVTDFGGTISSLSIDPTDSTNSVLMTDRTAGAQFWAGTTLSTSSGLASSIPFSSSETFITTRVFSPVSGINIRLKAEDHTNSGISVETEVTLSTANAWTTLVFDFSNEVVGTAPIDFSNTYDMLSIFYDFGNVPANSTIFYLDSVDFLVGGAITGCTDPSALNFDPLATFDDALETFDGVLEIFDEVLAILKTF